MKKLTIFIFLLTTTINAQIVDKISRDHFNFYVVTANILNVREKPTRNSEIIGQIKKGDVVTVYTGIESEDQEDLEALDDSGESYYWNLIKTGDNFGWILSKYIIETSEMKDSFKYYDPIELLKTGIFLDNRKEIITEFIDNKWMIGFYNWQECGNTPGFNINFTGNNPYVLNIEEIHIWDGDDSTENEGIEVEPVTRIEKYKIEISMKYNKEKKEYISSGPGMFLPFLKSSDINKRVKTKNRTFYFWELFSPFSYKYF
ncbi:MAG: SH3 domain-containing protein [Spirochaetes bacterium]|nr:SH3 domain-containing protein [Spirochaetota bacterium]